MQETLQDIQGKQATIIAISGDPLDQAKKITDDLTLGYAVLSDEKGDVARAYGVEDPANGTAWPALFVIGPDAKVVKRMILETYKERPLPETILAALGGETQAE